MFFENSQPGATSSISFVGVSQERRKPRHLSSGMSFAHLRTKQNHEEQTYRRKQGKQYFSLQDLAVSTLLGLPNNPTSTFHICTG
jgi:hypothetical protein